MHGAFDKFMRTIKCVKRLRWDHFSFWEHDKTNEIFLKIFTVKPPNQVRSAKI